MLILFPLIVFLISLTLSFNLYFSRNDVLSKVASLFCVLCIVELSKRLMYLYGDSPSEFYYIILFIPDYLIILDILIKKKIQKRIKYLIGVSISYLLIGLLQGQEVISILITLRTLVLLFVLIWLYKLPQTNQTSYVSQRSYMLIIGTTILSILYGTYQFFIGYPIWEVNWDLYSPAQMNLSAISNFGTQNRAFGFFSEVANFGVALCFSIIMTLYNTKKNIFRLITLFILFYGVLISGSKAALVSLVLAIPVGTFLFYYKKLIFPFVCLLYSLQVAGN